MILALTILMSAAMFFFALMYLNLYRAERQLGGQEEVTMAADEAAIAGLYAAARELKAASAWNTGFNAVSLPATGATYTVTFTNGSVPYSTNNAAGTGTVTGYGGRSIPPGTIHIVSVGKLGSATVLEQAIMVPAQAPFGFGLFGDNQLTVGSYAYIDAYDSTTGTLSTSGGNIGTNTTASGKINLGTGSVVNGIVQVGVGGTSSVIKGTGSYQGIQVATTAWPDAPVSAPLKVGTKNPNISGTTTLAPGAYHDVNVGNNETLVLSGGTYVVHNLTLADNSTLIVQGPVEWWFTGNQNFGKNTRINANGSSKDFKMLGNSTPQSTITFKDNATGFVCVYAPFCNLNINVGAELWGSFETKNITIQNGTSTNFVKIHNDTGLTKQSVSFNILTQW